MKRPKDMTNAELAALPTEMDEEFVPWTEEQVRNGALGRGYTRAISKEAAVTAWQDDDLVFWQDSRGNNWSFAQLADGGWCKVPSAL